MIAKWLTWWWWAFPCCLQVLSTVQTSERTGESEESRSPGHVSSWMLGGTPETPSSWSKVPGLVSSCSINIQPSIYLQSTVYITLLLNLTSSVAERKGRTVPWKRWMAQSGTCSQVHVNDIKALNCTLTSPCILPFSLSLPPSFIHTVLQFLPHWEG